MPDSGTLPHTVFTVAHYCTLPHIQLLCKLLRTLPYTVASRALAAAHCCTAAHGRIITAHYKLLGSRTLPRALLRHTAAHCCALCCTLSHTTVAADCWTHYCSLPPRRKSTHCRAYYPAHCPAYYPALPCNAFRIAAHCHAVQRTAASCRTLLHYHTYTTARTATHTVVCTAVHGCAHSRTLLCSSATAVVSSATLSFMTTASTARTE
jgi:hypothetical protein